MKHDELFEKFIYLNKSTKKFLDRAVEKVAIKYNMSNAELFVLSIVAHNPNMEKSCNIVKQHHFSKAYVSQSIKSLKSKGYIDSEIDENDKRYQKIILKDKSKKIIKDLNLEFDNCINIIKKDITEDELNCLSIVFEKIVNNVKNSKEEK